MIQPLNLPGGCSFAQHNMNQSFFSASLAAFFPTHFPPAAIADATIFRQSERAASTTILALHNAATSEARPEPRPPPSVAERACGEHRDDVSVEDKATLSERTPFSCSFESRWKTHQTASQPLLNMPGTKLKP